MMAKRPFHFHTLGFRRNPFGALTPEEWGAIAIVPPGVQAALSASDHVQLIGPKGSGKTTTLRRIYADAETVGQRVAYAYVAEGEHRYQTTLTGLDLFLLDEAQRLSRWRRRQWLRGVKNGHLRTIFSSHVDLSKAFRAWELPLKTIYVNKGVDEAHYTAVLRQRLAYFALDQTPRISFTPDAITYLNQTFGQDMREAEYFLYEVWQQIEHPGELTAEFLHQTAAGND